MKCPLCESDNILELEPIDKYKLNKLYKKFTGVDFSYLLTENILYCECNECKLKFFNPPITGDERFYNSLQKFDWYYMDEKEEYEYAKKYIKKTDKVLEVGCGKGAFAKKISLKNYIGLDSSVNAKIMSAANGIQIENKTIEEYAQQSPNTFDVVISFQVLEHVLDPKNFIENQIKALKIGGKLIISIPSESSFLKYVTNGILNMPPHHVTRWSDETLKFIAKEYSLEIIDIYHEKLQKSHQHQYLTTLLQNSLCKNKLIDLSILNKIISKVCSLLSKLFIKGFEQSMLPIGQNVLVVYKKGDNL